MFKGANDDRSDTDRTEGRGGITSAFAFVQRSHIGSTPRSRQNRVKPGVIVQSRQSTVQFLSSVFEKKRQNGVRTSCSVGVLPLTLVCYHVGGELPVIGRVVRQRMLLHG